jgi:hypothetical protein
LMALFNSRLAVANCVFNASSSTDEPPFWRSDANSASRSWTRLSDASEFERRRELREPDGDAL